MAGGFFGLSFIGHKTMFLDPDHNAIVGVGDIPLFEVGLDPDDILTPLKAPRLNKFPTILEMFRANPQKQERSSIPQVPNPQPIQLVHGPSLIVLGFLLELINLPGSFLILLPWRIT